MATATTRAPEFLRRAEAADMGKQGYAIDDNRVEPSMETQLGPDDFGERRRLPSPSDHVNLARIELAISDVAGDRVGSRPTRLQRIAEDMLELRWEEFVALADGVKGDAKVMHAWAKANIKANAIPDRSIHSAECRTEGS